MPVLLLRPLIFAVLFFVITMLVNFLVNRFMPELLAGGGRDDDFHPGSRIDITDEDMDFSQSFDPASAQGGYSPPRGQVFMGAQADDSEEGLGNISDLLKRGGMPPAPTEGILPGTGSGMDQNAESGYNGEGDLEELAETDPFAAWDPLPLAKAPASREAASPREATPRSAQAPGAQSRQQVPDDGGDPASVDFLPDLDSMAGAFLSSSAEEDSDTIEYSVSTPVAKPSRSSSSPAWSGDFNAKDMAAGLRTVLSKEKEG